MSKSTQATRFAIVTFFTMTLTFALAITFAPLAFGHDQHCIDLDWSEIICDQHNGTGGGDGGSESTPTPAPTPPPRDYAAEHSHALGLAIAGLEAQLPAVTPDWQIWPPEDANQIVFLPSFLAITDAGWKEIEVTGSAGPNPPTTVTLTATPYRTKWTLTETDGPRTVHEFFCVGEHAQGSPWSPGVDPEPGCGWTPKSTSDITGPVELEVVIEYELSWISSYAGTQPNAGTAESRPGTGTLAVSEVQTIGSTDFTSERGGNATVTAPEGDDIEITNEDAAGNGGSGGGNGGGSGGDPSGAGDGTITIRGSEGDSTRNLPVRSLACSVELQGEAHLAIGPELKLGVHYIVEEFADGTRVVTIAADVGAGLGVGGSVGAYATFGDYTIGGFAKAEAEIWGALGAGREYVIGPDEDFDTRFAEIVNGLVLDDINPVPNGILGAFGLAVPQAPAPDAQFHEFRAWLEGGGNAQVGTGLINAFGGADASVGYAERVKTGQEHVSLITTYTGSLDIGLVDQGPGGSQTGVSLAASGSLSLETIYNDDRQPIELVMTRTYSIDGDEGDLGAGNDTPTQTTQQWRLDLTNPAIADAVLDIDETFGPTANSSALGVDKLAIAKGLFDSFGTTTGPLVQEVTTTNTPFGVGAGLGADFEVSGGSGCLELS